MTILSSVRAFFILLTVLLLTSCGGGGDSESSSGGYSIAVDTASIALTSSYKGKQTAGGVVNVTFKGDGLVVGIPPGGTLPNWLDVVVEQSTTSTARVRFRVYSTQVFDKAFNETVTVRLVSGSQDGAKVVFKDVNVSLAVTDAIYFNGTALDYELIAGGATQEIGQLAIDTLGKTWRVQSKPDWLTLSQETGTGALQLKVSADPKALSSQTYTGTLVVASGDTVHRQEYSVTPTAARVYTDHAGFAFAQIPNFELLQKEMQFKTNGGGAPGEWRVVTKPSWLQITGTNKLTLSYVRNSMPDGLHCGDLTLQFTASPEKPTTLHGCVYQQATLTRNHGTFLTMTQASSWGAFNNVLAVDTVRPYFYVFNRASEKIEGYNLYSGELVVTLPPVSQFPTSMVVSDDGKFLYAKTDSGYQIFDLLKNTASVREVNVYFTNPAEIKFGRIAGQPFLYNHGIGLYDLTTQRVFGVNYQSSWYPTMTADGKSMFAIDGTAIRKYSLSYREASQNVTMTQPTLFNATAQYAVPTIQNSVDNTELFQIISQGGLTQSLVVYDHELRSKRQINLETSNGLYDFVVTDQKIVTLNYTYPEMLMTVYDLNGLPLQKHILPSDYRPAWHHTLDVSPYGDRAIGSLLIDSNDSVGKVVVHDL